MQTDDKKCYIVGNCNINLLNYHFSGNCRCLMFAYSLAPLNNRPIRINKSSAIVIDNAIHNHLVGLAMVLNECWSQKKVITFQFFTSKEGVKNMKF